MVNMRWSEGGSRDGVLDGCRSSGVPHHTFLLARKTKRKTVTHTFVSLSFDDRIILKRRFCPKTYDEISTSLTSFGLAYFFVAGGGALYGDNAGLVTPPLPWCWGAGYCCCCFSNGDDALAGTNDV
jgi:hypothetical protein